MITLFLAATASALILDARRGGPVCPSAADGEEVVVCAARRYPKTVLPVTIAGRPARLLIEPGGHDELTCNPAFVQRAGIRGNSPVTLGLVGPIKVVGARGNTTMTVAGRSDRYDVPWTSQPLSIGTDCVIGPRRLPFSEIRFLFDGRQRASAPFVLPFYRTSDSRTYGRLPVGRHVIAVRFEHARARTVLTAPAAHAIAPELGGTATGPALADEITYGIARPVRALVLDRPLQLGGLGIDRPFVRVADYGDAANIRSLAAEDADDGAVQVSVRRRAPGQVRLLRIGGDDLDRCASLTVDKRRREIVLAC